MTGSSSSSTDPHTRRYLQAILVPSHRDATPAMATAAAASTTKNGQDEPSKIEEGGSTPPSHSPSNAEQREDEEDEGRRPATPKSRAPPPSSSATAAATTMRTPSQHSNNAAAATTTTTTTTTTPPVIDTESRIKRVIDLLSDPDTPEEDKPEKLKELLQEVTAGTEASNADLDATALAILHRHREDVEPTGQTFSSPTPTPRPGPSLSRSSSFRRNLTPTSASTLAMKRAGIPPGVAGTPTRPLSPSPLGPQSPSITLRSHSSHASNHHDPFGQATDYAPHPHHPYPHPHHHQHPHGSSASSTTASSTPSSPFGSPRFLNAAAHEFKPNAGAAEFKPANPSSLSAPKLSLHNLAVRTPESVRSRSPAPSSGNVSVAANAGTPLSEASPTMWAFAGSPLGTPKFSTGGISASSSFTGLSGSYFPPTGPGTPSAVGTPSSTLATAPPIPSDPWNKAGDDLEPSGASNPDATHSASTASSERSYDGGAFDPPAALPSSSSSHNANSNINSNTYSNTSGSANGGGSTNGSSTGEASTGSGKAQILSSEDEEEWAIPGTSNIGEGSSLGDFEADDDDTDQPRWNLYDDERDELKMMQFRGGQLVPDELGLVVEPPAHERPVFEEGYYPQSTSQYSQLPEDFSGGFSSHTPQEYAVLPLSQSQQPFLPPNIPPGFGEPPYTPTYPGTPGLGGSSANYIMTPFDVLCSIFADTDIAPADIEEALSRNGWDVDRSMEWIVNNPRLPNLPSAGAADDAVDSLHMAGLDITHDGGHRLPGSGASTPSRMMGGARGGTGSRPLIISRDSFQRNFNRPQSPRWAAYGNTDGRSPHPLTPGGRSDRSGTASDGYFGPLGSHPLHHPHPHPHPHAPGPPTPGGPTTRLCKYFLQGNCLRSDCRFSHDLSKAVCKFWLRGNCLKGEGRCEFLHSVPPHLAQDVAALRMNALREREREKARGSRGGIGFDDDFAAGGRRVEEDFPTLASASSAHSGRGGLGGPPRGPHKDPATSRWAGIVKNGRPVNLMGLDHPENLTIINNRPSLPRSPSSSSQTARDPSSTLLGGGTTRNAPPPFSQPRQSARLPLRPPTLLPTITTGAAVAKMYEQYRENFFELGNARNKCLVKASNCWKQGDGAGARRWSREAQDWNRQIAKEGSLVAGKIVEERKKALRESVMSSAGRPGRADEVSDRQYRGKECGNGLGICLGVAAAGEALGPEGARLAAAERTEAAIDLHGLHPDEAIDILEKFLVGLTRDSVMRGLAYVIVGQERHTGSSDLARGSRKVRLADAVGSWLDSYNYAFWLTSGIYAIDPFQ